MKNDDDSDDKHTLTAPLTMMNDKGQTMKTMNQW